LLAATVAVAACGPGARPRASGDAGASDASPDAACVSAMCSADQRDVLDCHGNVLVQCSATDACDPIGATCENACTVAQDQHRSVGCDYYATDMTTLNPSYCYVAFVANTWSTSAHIGVEWAGASLDPSTFTSLPTGTGASITYGAYDGAAGIPSGSVAILFLSGKMGAAPDCPLPPAVGSASIPGTGIGSSFHITSDVPVVAYQMNPYGGGSAAVTGASLLIPTSAWDVNYVAVNTSGHDSLAEGSGTLDLDPSLNIVASLDNTTVTLTPVAAVTGGSGVASGSAGQPLTITLNAGQQAQITQPAELTGSIVSSNNPVGFMAGHYCMRMPIGVQFCDHAEQMIPPVRALGWRYAGVMYRARTAMETQTYWRAVGAVDNTQLTYSSNVGGPAALDKGEAVTFETGTPFTVQSQDAMHPFMLFTYMTGSHYVDALTFGYGDPDFVYNVPPDQYLANYVFFTDPNFPETNLVVVRTTGSDGQFHDVNLDCGGALTGWAPLGRYEWTRVDLSTGDFTPVGACNNGRHEITSDAPFGLQVWGWGSPATGCAGSTGACGPGEVPSYNVSYGYPGGMNVAPINTVVIQ
jgi:hypothetical protein